MRSARFPRGIAFSIALVLTVSALPGSAADPPPPASTTPVPSHVRLSNGLTVVVVEDHRLPVIALRIAYRHDELPPPGALRFVAPRLMIDATKHVSSGQYDSLLENAGARNETWGVTLDSTYFAVTVPSNAVDLPLWLWSDQMAFLTPRLDSSMIARAVALARQDRRMRIDDTPCATSEQEARVALYPPSHPYRQSPRGFPEGDEVELASMTAFVEEAYRPDVAALFFVGDISAAEGLARARKWFGDIPSAARRPTPVDPSLPAGEAHIAIRALVSAARVRITWRIPREYDVPSRWRVFENMLGGQETGLLRWELRDSRRLVSTISTSYDPRAHGSTFSIDATVAAGHTPEEVVSAVDAFLDALPSKDVGALHLDWAREEGMRADLLEGATTSERAARLAGAWLINGTASLTSGPWDLDAAHLATLVGSALEKQHRAVLTCTPDPSASIAGITVSRNSGVTSP